jgi:hypothetical protein
LGKLRDVRRKLAKRNGKREYLNEEKSRDLLNRLEKYSEKKVAVPQIRRGRTTRN